MAIFKYFPNVISNDSSTYKFVAGSGTETSFLLRDINGNSFTVTGTGFTYGPSAPLGGQVTGMVQANAAGQSIISATKLAFGVADLVKALAMAPFDSGYALLMLMTKGADRVQGSTLDDQIFGGAKADKMFGAAGSDFLASGQGNDTMSGGGGADTFLFEQKGDGANVITDFTDRNGAQDDVIMISRAAYRAMVVTEDATGVLLTFSATSSVHVDGWHASQVGLNDFVFM